MKHLVIALLVLISYNLYAPSIDFRQRRVWELNSIDINVYSLSHKTKVLITIIEQESGGDSLAYNKQEDAVSILQLRKVYVDEVNRISHKKFTYKDRWDINKSIEMFYIINDKYNPTYNLELAAHIHNAGAFKIKERWKYTKEYRKQIREIYDKLD